MSDNKTNDMSHSASDAQKEELGIFLDGLDKRRYLDQLVQAGIVSVDQLAENEGTIPGAPRMVTRLLHTKAQETEELRWVLRGKMIEYLQPLMQAKIYTVSDLLEAETLPIPRMAARVVRKKAEQFHQARAVRDFLKSINQERHFETIASQLQITTPEQLRDTCMEKLTRSTCSRMVARLSIRKAQELCPLDDPPSPPDLTPQQKSEIRIIYQAIQEANHESFGTTFYETLLSMDTKATALFAGVSLKTLGRDFDDSLTLFVENLDHETDFEAHRNALVERLLHYRVPCRTLWLAGDAFCLAAMSQCPEVELLPSTTLSSWKALYYAMIPPLHPAMIKAASVTTQAEWDLKKRDFFPRMHEALARRGYLYFTQWLQGDAFVDNLWAVITSLRAYQQGRAGWNAFVESSRELVDGMDSDEMKVTLLIELPLTVADRMSPEYGLNLGNVLTTAACSLFGIDQVSSTFRAIQRERVWDQWGDIYRFAHNEFGERFYELFTRNPVIAHLFGTVATMQRERFVHQLNVVLIRINEDLEEVVRPMLVEIGARHRVHHMIGSREMNMFGEPLLQAIRDMLGRSNWRDETADAWAYVANILQEYMMVGWTCGMGVLRTTIMTKKRATPNAVNRRVLRKLRDESPNDFGRFFGSFAGAVQGINGSQVFANGVSAAKRYLDCINKILDETDTTVALDRIQSLGRRHREYHGVDKVDVLSAAAKHWMSEASSVFGKRFTADVAIEWALLWEVIAASILPQYETAKPTLEELVAPYLSTLQEAMKPSKKTLTLKDKIFHPNDTVLLRFAASPPVVHKAGQFAKLRWKMPDKNVSRFYSIASCPDPATGTASMLEFLVKEVAGGRMSPYLVNEFMPPSTCEVLTTAGSFVMDLSGDEARRLMVSAGVGIVAFVSTIRFVAAHIKHKSLQSKVVLSMIHSERIIPFPFMNELLEIWNEFGCDQHDKFRFDFTFCYTGSEEQKVSKLEADYPRLKVYRERVGQPILANCLQQFSTPAETPIYVCGPGIFQRTVRETFLKKMGHSRKLMHLEFFDL